MPLEVVAVPSDLLLYLPPHSNLIIAGLYVLPVGINKACPGGRRYRLDSVPIDVFDAELPEFLDELGCFRLKGSGQAQPRCYRSLAALVMISAWYLRCSSFHPT